LSAAITPAQLDPSAHAPCASTTLTSFVVIVLLPENAGRLGDHNLFEAY
jgi:hypothetical protein